MEKLSKKKKCKTHSSVGAYARRTMEKTDQLVIDGQSFVCYLRFSHFFLYFRAFIRKQMNEMHSKCGTG